ncbi:hypothetical protein Rumeso_03593 [Rubellimicrobium mesophilum DSM 19309]|uniref:Antitoxin Xre/MbcA/ParS-like toxin-binding domain-containing protein n=1 Tax=Rubellimicrobium mesophilum DSM 19309 TaxID=442562 RepID=A0A017HKD7_9RHOB|nr:hypothetical protein [Rubellimicrobium mesophilum]EYD74826.1 hypothetical protein Rumeso_03593 [Rubellimicrobium mesophilum DSM 19309]
MRKRLNRTPAERRAAIEDLIDRDNARMRADFLAQFAVLDGTQVLPHLMRPGLLALPGGNGPFYPAFQFNPQGQPWPLLATVLAALPSHLSPWQRAYWLVAPDDRLGGETPIARIARSDPQVVEAAHRAGELPIG